jgi:hypothetical protein
LVDTDDGGGPRFAFHLGVEEEHGVRRNVRRIVRNNVKITDLS